MDERQRKHSQRPPPKNARRPDPGLADHLSAELRSAYEDIYAEAVPGDMIDAARQLETTRRQRS